MKILSDNPIAVIFHRNPQPKAEAFALEQANYLCRYEPYYTSDSPTSPDNRICSIASQDRYAINAGTFYRAASFTVDLFATLKRISPALVHARSEESGLAALRLTKELDVPLVTTIDEPAATSEVVSGPRPFLRRVFGSLRKDLQCEGRLFVASSDFMRESLIERGYPERRTASLPVGVDIDLFKPQPVDPKDPMVLFVGRMVEKKGVSYLLQAMKEVTKVRKDARLVLIGDGPLLNSLIDQAIALDLPRVIFFGSRDAESVRYQMGMASLLVAPSIMDNSGDSESIPRIIAEAQAMGLPVVSTYHGGIPEIVRNGQNGLLVPERSIHQLAQNILLILAQPCLQREMGLAARQNVCSNFNLKLQTARLEEFYAEAVREQAWRQASR